jgi:O-antigen/teichoic acid export membrane protein
MDLFFLAIRTDPVQLGIYGAGLTIATIPEIFGAYLAPVFLPRILPSCREGVFYALFRRFHAIAYGCCGVALAASLPLAKPVLSHVLPTKYLLSLDITRILLPGTLAVACVFPLTLNFLMLKKPKAFLTIDLAAAPFLAMAYLMVPHRNGALAAAWITSAFRVAKSGVAQLVAWRLARRENNPPVQSGEPHGSVTKLTAATNSGSLDI